MSTPLYLTHISFTVSHIRPYPEGSTGSRQIPPSESSEGPISSWVGDDQRIPAVVCTLFFDFLLFIHAIMCFIPHLLPFAPICGRCRNWGRCPKPTLRLPEADPRLRVPYQEDDHHYETEFKSKILHLLKIRKYPRPKSSDSQNRGRSRHRDGGEGRVAAKSDRDTGLSWEWSQRRIIAGHASPKMTPRGTTIAILDVTTE